MLPKNTLFIGKVVMRFAELPSTNDYAQKLLAKSKPAPGTVVITDHQSAGRGQIGSKWVTNPGENLTLSVILYPKFLLARDQFILNQMVALAVRDFIAEYTSKRVWIKWPNDIYIEDRKVCGLLIQTTINARHLQSCVIGIGVNVNQTAFHPEILNATSLALENESPFVLDDLLPDLFYYLESYYLQLRSTKLDQIEKKYKAHLYRINEKHLYQRPDGSQFEAILTGTNKRGQLLLLSDKGLETFDIKGVKFL